MTRHTLPKQERLSSKKSIELLFKEGQSLFVHPLKLMYLQAVTPTSNSNLQIAFTVPKRSFKKATDRNLLKRRMREAYRLNKSPLHAALNEKKQSYIWMLIFVHKEILDQTTLQTSLIRLNKLFIKTISPLTYGQNIEKSS